MQNYSKVGGVLSIIAGAFGVLGLFMAVGLAILFGFIFSDPAVFDEAGAPPEGVFVMIIAIYALMGLFYAAVVPVNYRQRPPFYRKDSTARPQRQADC